MPLADKVGDMGPGRVRRIREAESSDPTSPTLRKSPASAAIWRSGAGTWLKV